MILFICPAVAAVVVTKFVSRFGVNSRSEGAAFVGWIGRKLSLPRRYCLALSEDEISRKRQPPAF